MDGKSSVFDASVVVAAEMVSVTGSVKLSVGTADVFGIRLESFSILLQEDKKQTNNPIKNRENNILLQFTISPLGSLSPYTFPYIDNTPNALCCQ